MKENAGVANLALWKAQICPDGLWSCHRSGIYSHHHYIKSLLSASGIGRLRSVLMLLRGVEACNRLRANNTAPGGLRACHTTSMIFICGRKSSVFSLVLYNAHAGVEAVERGRLKRVETNCSALSRGSFRLLTAHNIPENAPFPADVFSSRIPVVRCFHLATSLRRRA